MSAASDEEHAREYFAQSKDMCVALEGASPPVGGWARLLADLRRVATRPLRYGYLFYFAAARPHTVVLSGDCQPCRCVRGAEMRVVAPFVARDMPWHRVFPLAEPGAGAPESVALVLGSIMETDAIGADDLLTGLALFVMRSGRLRAALTRHCGFPEELLRQSADGDTLDAINDKLPGLLTLLLRADDARPSAQSIFSAAAAAGALDVDERWVGDNVAPVPQVQRESPNLTAEAVQLRCQCVDVSEDEIVARMDAERPEGWR